MKISLWSSLAGSLLLVAAATGCNTANTTNQVGNAAGMAGNAVQNAAGAAGNVAGRAGNAIGSAAGAAGNAVGDVGRAAGNAVGDVGRAAGRAAGGVANAAGDMAGAVGNGVAGGVNRAGSGVVGGGNGVHSYPRNNTGLNSGALTSPRVATSMMGALTAPAVNVDNGTRTVTLRFEHVVASAVGWRPGQSQMGANNQVQLTMPTGWTLRVANASPSANHVALGIIPYATADSPANGLMSTALTITMPGRYQIVSQTPSRVRNILGMVTVMPAVPGINFSFGPNSM